MQNFDVAISGGGMVGSSLAVMLASCNYSVAIIEPNPISDFNIASEQDFRGLALSKISKNILQHYKLWEHIAKHAVPIDKVHVSSTQGFSSFAFDEGELGAVVEGGLLTATLQEHCRNCNNITTFYQQELLDCNFISDAWEIALTGEAISTKLLVGCDGISSKVSEKLNISIDVHDFRQTAIVANLDLHTKHSHTAYKRFYDNGSLALVPYKNNTMKSILVCGNENAQEYLAESDLEYINRLESICGSYIGAVKHIGKRVSYPLLQRRAKALTKDNAILLGNSALTIHPIAAQGFNLALRDASALVELLQENNITTALAKYSEWRTTEHMKIISSTHKIMDMFINDSSIKSLGASLGMLATRHSSYIKNKLMEHMLGYGEVLPKAAL